MSEFVRPIRPEDRGILEGEVARLSGTIAVTGTNAVVQIDLIEAEILDLFAVLRGLSSIARSYGAVRLRVQASLAN